MLIEQMLFDAPASLQPFKPQGIGLAKPLSKGLFARQPGVENHRIAQQQLVVPVMAQ